MATRIEVIVLSLTASTGRSGRTPASRVATRASAGSGAGPGGSPRPVALGGEGGRQVLVDVVGGDHGCEEHDARGHVLLDEVAERLALGDQAGQGDAVGALGRR